MSKSLKLIIESMLFSSEKPLTINDISSCLPDIERSEIKNTLKVLIYEYQGLERSFELREVAKGFQFRSKSEYGAYILRMLQKSPNRLSRAAMETLAIIAYKQPILRHEIERLRGVDVGGILRTLLEKNLIRIMGRKDLPGKPLIYGTTKLFLEMFDLKNISSLPKLKEIKEFGAEEYEPTEKDFEEASQGEGQDNNENKSQSKSAEPVEDSSGIIGTVESGGDTEGDGERVLENEQADEEDRDRDENQESTIGNRENEQKNPEEKNESAALDSAGETTEDGSERPSED